jgi:cysteine desulfurase
MNLEEDIIEGSLRLGLGKFTTDAEILSAADILSQSIQAIREVMST